MTIRILLVDDHHIVRQGLRSLLSDEDGMEVVGEAEDGRSASDLARALKPDVVVMDIRMPVMNGIDATRAILTSLPETKVVALTMRSERQFVTSMLRTGACAYVLKEGAFEELAHAIREAMAGRQYLSPQVADLLERRNTT